MINGPTEICSNTSGNYFLTNPLGLTAYHWNVPDGVEIVYGQGTNFVQLFFSQMAPNPSHISLTGANGCGNGSTPLDVTVHPSYVNIVHDTVCSGETYSQYGFDLGVLEESGNFVHTRTDSSAYGCENIDIVMNELDTLANVDYTTRMEKEEHRSLTIVRIGTCGGLQPFTPTGCFRRRAN